MGKNDAEPDPRETVGIIDALLRQGFSDAEFRSLHHLGDSPAGFRRYCSKLQSFVPGGRNHRLAVELQKELQKRLGPNRPSVRGR
jgi:hypothetical protein